MRADSQCDGVWAARAEWELCSSSQKKYADSAGVCTAEEVPREDELEKGKTCAAMLPLAAARLACRGTGQALRS